LKFKKKTIQPMTGPEGTSACSGDSGGPLTQYLDGSSYLLGLVSWGPKICNETAGVIPSPDVYTDVRWYKSWLDAETSKATLEQNEENVFAEDSLEALAPQCGGANCFFSRESLCSFIESPFVRCNDEVNTDIGNIIFFLYNIICQKNDIISFISYR
jgi:secreted trypsin-like serine protease